MQTFFYVFTLSCWVYWLFFYWGGGRLIARDVKHASASNTFEMGLLVTIVILVLLIFGTGLLITIGCIPTEGGLWLRGTGVLLTLTGMTGTFYCRRYLGRFWAADTTLQTNHHVVDTGPYGIVRHPIYTAALLMYLGTALVFSVWWNGVAYLGLLITHLLKTWTEDRFLAEELAGYVEYQKRVRYRSMPALW